MDMMLTLLKLLNNDFSEEKVMLNREWKQFKSGTDIRGVAVEYKENKVNLTDDAVRAMAGGFVLWLSNKVGKKPIELKISVGRDSRISGEHILGLCADVMKESGAEVIDCGLSSTPAMFMTTVDLACDGALQITASHHPFYRNGLKFFTRDGGLEAEDIEAILQFAQDGKTPEKVLCGTITKYNYMKDYSAGLREIIKRLLMQRIMISHLQALRLLLMLETVQADFMLTMF